MVLVVLDGMELMHLLYHDYFLAGIYNVQIWGSGDLMEMV